MQLLHVHASGLGKLLLVLKNNLPILSLSPKYISYICKTGNISVLTIYNVRLK